MDGSQTINPYLAGNFAPAGWAFADGKRLSIAANAAMFSALGDRLGGNGTTTFARPDLSDRVAVGGAELGVGGEKGVELAMADCVDAIAELAQHGAGGSLVPQQGVAGGRLVLDDHQGGIDPLLPLPAVLLGLGAEVVDVVEHHLVERPDRLVEVARDGDVEDQGQAVPPGLLDPGIERQVDDRLGGGGGADDEVGVDQGFFQLLPGDGPAGPSGGGTCSRSLFGGRLIG